MKRWEKVLFTIAGILLVPTISLVCIIMLADSKGYTFKPVKLPEAVQAFLHTPEPSAASATAGTLPSQSAVAAAADTAQVTEQALASIPDTVTREGDPSTEVSYVLDSSTMKFHNSSCHTVTKSIPDNYSTSASSREDLLAEGYTACELCMK